MYKANEDYGVGGDSEGNSDKGGSGDKEINGGISKGKEIESSWEYEERFEVKKRVYISEHAWGKLKGFGIRRDAKGKKKLLEAIHEIDSINLVAASPVLPGLLRGIYRGKFEINGKKANILLKNYYSRRRDRPYTVILSIYKVAK